MMICLHKNKHKLYHVIQVECSCKFELVMQKLDEMQCRAVLGGEDLTPRDMAKELKKYVKELNEGKTNESTDSK